MIENFANQLSMPGSFQCECGVVASSDEELKIHITVVHLEWIPYVCSLCDNVFLPTEGSVVRHFKTSHTNSTPNKTTIFFIFNEEKANKLNQMFYDNILNHLNMSFSPGANETYRGNKIRPKQFTSNFDFTCNRTNPRILGASPERISELEHDMSAVERCPDEFSDMSERVGLTRNMEDLSCPPKRRRRSSKKTSLKMEMVSGDTNLDGSTAILNETHQSFHDSSDSEAFEKLEDSSADTPSTGARPKRLRKKRASLGVKPEISKDEVEANLQNGTFRKEAFPDITKLSTIKKTHFWQVMNNATNAAVKGYLVCRWRCGGVFYDGHGTSNLRRHIDKERKGGLRADVPKPTAPLQAKTSTTDNVENAIEETVDKSLTVLTDAPGPCQDSSDIEMIENSEASSMSATPNVGQKQVPSGGTPAMPKTEVIANLFNGTFRKKAFPEDAHMSSVKQKCFWQIVDDATGVPVKGYVMCRGRCEAVVLDGHGTSNLKRHVARDRNGRPCFDRADGGQTPNKSPLEGKESTADDGESVVAMISNRCEIIVSKSAENGRKSQCG